MAPALSLSPQEPLDRDAARETDKLSPQRRALASVDNLSTHMEEDDMGLQHQPSLVKDSQEMEQILVDLGSSDLAQADLLQAIKTLEGGGDNLSAGDPDSMFPLSGFDLAETADSEGDAAEDKIRLLQVRLERRCAFLQRRLRILQARAIGKRVSEEAAQTFDKCTRGARKDGGGRPIGMKALLKRIETTSALQASAASRTVVGPKYYHAGTSRGDSRSATVGISSGTLTGLQDTAGALRSHLSVVKHELDSDATASSSGAESNDEAVVYNNPHQQHMPIEKRALWAWQRARASVSTRWTWLQAQVQELEYKIRQHNDLHRQVREAKGQIEFEGSPMAYEGSLPGSELADDDPRTETCARLRPLRRETFKKRKLLQMHNLHIATSKAAKPSEVRCSCQFGVESCGVCTGRAEPTEPAVPLAALASKQRVAHVDHSYHAVLSDHRDISPLVHIASLTSRSWFRSRCSKAWRGSRHAHSSHAHSSNATQSPQAVHSGSTTVNSPATSTHHTPRPYRRNPTRLKRGRPPLSRKVRERERERDRDDETTTATPHERRGPGRPSTESRRRQSYDIDNIVIPQSVAANTRPQILTYKEILTPKWRVMKMPGAPLNNGVGHSMSIESDEEDISDAAVALRHSRAETSERVRFARNQRPRRANHDASNLPPPPVGYWLPQSASQNAPPASVAPHETVRPYSPREFPLREDTYVCMLQAMPDGHRASPDHNQSYDGANQSYDGANQSYDGAEPGTTSYDDSSTLSPLSVCAFDGDDPDDAEWEPTVEKTERRKSTFR